ncbi:MAG: hypothetical protein KDD83_16335, partial [Caldilineaceae bacterium]|nr:hypothetical protein [Caldilineaceae bacterium]
MHVVINMNPGRTHRCCNTGRRRFMRSPLPFMLLSIMLVLGACNRQSDSQATPIPTATSPAAVR